MDKKMKLVSCTTVDPEVRITLNPPFHKAKYLRSTSEALAAGSS